MNSSPSSETKVRTLRGVQQTFIALAAPSSPAPTIEAKGVVYTKPWVVELILDLAQYLPETNLVDRLAVEPSAGGGAFLGPMIERLTASCRNIGKPLSACRDSLIAFELDDESASRSRLLAAGILINRGATAELADELAHTWVRTGDYLLDASSANADFVVGNPPYVRLESIPDQVARHYRHSYPTMSGRADLYVAFFEAALRQLRDAGVCVFICADRWMRNQYGSELRKMITTDYAVEVIIEMHRADAFREEVDAYPAITVIRRRPYTRTLVASAGQQAETHSPQLLSSTIQGAFQGRNPVPPDGVRMAVVATWFKGSDPWPCQSPQQLKLLRQLEDRFPALESHAKVGIGVATGNDGVFITEDPDLVEGSRLLKLALAGDISRGQMNWSGHYLVDPWNHEGLVDLGKYPKLASYFTRNSQALKRRHTAKKNSAGWYKTIDRVTHSLSAQPKLYIADIKNVLDPVLDRGETYPHHNLYFVQSEEWDLEVLGGLLMSSVGQFFVESYGVRMRGGYLRFQAQYLRRIRVPTPMQISASVADSLREAFRTRDRHLATQIALSVYGIDKRDMEDALGENALGS